MHHPRIAIALTLAAFAAAPAAADWPHLRGPTYDGRTAEAPVPADEPVALELDWRVPLGSGYSGIAVAGARVVTLFADGASDFVAAFELESGRELWRHRLGEVNRGRDGSRDGPISTPVIDGGTVFALAPRGTLFALDLADGAVRWSLDLARRFSAREPDFGFGTTPLVADGVLVLAAGGSDGRAIVGLDPASGELVWSRGDGRVDYQSPVALTLAGQRQVVVVAGKTLLGLAPLDGEVLWRHELADGDGVGEAMAAPAGEDRFLLLVSGDAAVFEVRRGAGGMEVAELYRSRELGNTYALPVYREGTLFGFRGQVLAAVDAATGERLWRSRPPGGRGLVLVDDRLAIFGAGGAVVLARADRAGYVEEARVESLPASGYTWPSFDRGRIFVRNLEALASVAIETASAPPATAARTSDGGAADDGELGALLARVAAADDPEPLVDELFERHPSLPIVDGEKVHFLFRGVAEDVAIAGTVTGGRPEALARVGDSDLFHRAYERGGAPRWEYRFVHDYGELLPDPRNPRRVPASSGPEMSEVVFDGWREPDHLGEPDGPRGTLETIEFSSRRLGVSRRLRVYLPPGYPSGERLYPLLVVPDGDAWLEKGRLDRTLDHLVGRRIQPLVAVFVEPRGEWWLEAGGSGTDEYAKMLVAELVPFLERRYWVRRDPAGRALLGLSGYGLSSAYTVLSYPHLVGRAALVSVRLDLGAWAALFELIRRQPRPQASFYVDWSRLDQADEDSGLDARRDSRQLAAALQAAGFPVAGGEVDDSGGWGGWRARADRILEALFPLAGP